MTLRKTLPRNKWWSGLFWFDYKQYKERLNSIFPEELMIFWNASNWEISLVGPAPTFTDTPTLSAGGVIPGDGPSFTDVVAWEDGGTLVVEFTATVASTDLVGDVQVFGPLYAYSGGLKAMDGTNTASVATSWGIGDVVTAVVQVDASGVMRIGVAEGV